MLISVGLLGVAALQLTSLKNNQESYVRSQAAMLAADLLDRMRSNQAGFAPATTTWRALRAASTRRARPARLPLPTSQPGRQRSIACCRASDGDAAGRVVIDGNIVTISIRWREREEQGTARTYDPASLPMFQTRSEI